jgi:sugar O-acyltransferase (sialic acid O-acetyltransferase NeuD family)
VFGTGTFAEVARFYLEHDSPHTVVAFAADREHLPAEPTLDGLPVVPFDEVVQRHPPSEHAMFVAVGYRGLNRVRAEVCARARELGYELPSYVSTRATHWGDTRFGDNCFVLEDNTIQPFVELGDGVVLWSGNHIGHHAVIGEYAFLSSHVVVSGRVRIGAYTFLGVNATLADGITIGRANVIGAGALVKRSTADDAVHAGKGTAAARVKSHQLGL